MRLLRYTSIVLAILLIIGIGIYGTMRAGLWNTDYETMVAKYAGPPSKFVTIDDARLHYRDEGAGRILVLLHGSGASLHEWDLVADRLKTKYRVIRLDWPPFGLSTDATHVYSTTRAAELVGALVDHLELKKFTLVATSNGGNVALIYAAAHPDRLAAMAFSILPIVPLTPNRLPSPRVRFMTWFFGNYLPNYHSEWFYRTVFEETTPPSFTISRQELTTVYELNNLPGAADHLAQYLAANRKMFKTNDFVAAAEKITVPVLLQWCDLDTVIVPKTRGDEAKADFKNAPVTLIHYPDIGHFPEFENPDLFTRDLETFIDQLPPSKI